MNAMTPISLVSSAALQNCRILVTRPAQQADNLCHLIEQYDGEAVRLPVIDIVALEDKSPLIKAYQQLFATHIAIFISTNAVTHALPTLLKLGELPAQLLCIGVGQSTVACLHEFGIAALCPEPPFNSEMLLAMPQLQATQVHGKQVMVFRGEGGRELLAEGIRQRGGMVSYVSAYRRVQPTLPLSIQSWAFDAVIITSREGLQNLVAMLQRPAWLHETPLILMSERIMVEVQMQGLRSPVFIAPNASDEGLLAALLDWRNSI